MKKYSWNFNRDDELWYNGSEDSIEDCIEAAKQVVTDEDYQTDEPPQKVYIGENIPYIPAVDVESILEHLQEQAYDQCGEVGYDWDAYDHKKKEEMQELEEKLNEVVSEWLKKYNYYPNMWNVENIKEHYLGSVDLD